MPTKPIPRTGYPELDKRRVSLGLFMTVAGRK